MLENCARTVQFTQSTLVSICHASTHVHQTHYRFPIFPSLAPPPPRVPLSTKRGFHIDLHTSQSPIIACGCTHLQDLFCTGGGGGGEGGGGRGRDQVATTTIVLYAVKRKAESGEVATKRVTVSREKTYLFDQAWQPSVPQTARAMAALLSSLYRLTKSIPLQGAVAEGKVLAVLHELTGFPPAVRTREWTVIDMF